MLSVLPGQVKRRVNARAPRRRPVRQDDFVGRLDRFFGGGLVSWTAIHQHPGICARDTMPGMSRRLAVGAVLAMAALAGNAGAQSAAPCTMGVNNSFGYSLPEKTGAPFSATLKSTFEQKLPDGNSIRGVTRTHQARDSSGKTRTETPAGCGRGEDGQPHLALNVSVRDPVAKTFMNWRIDIDSIGPKVARVLHQQEQAPSQKTPEEMATLRNAAAMRQPSRSKSHREDLGLKTINGVTAKGSRVVRTIPAGEEGNALPLEVVTESWYSQELGLQMLIINDDPRRGKTTTEYEELSLGEPDPALFAVPVGYKVEEMHLNVVAGVQ